MWPLNEMVDESYTVYWRLCPEGGCRAPKTARGVWSEASGYLVAGQDLASEETTASKARRSCFDDPRCTSFCYNCGARGHGCPMECKRPRVFDPSEAQRPVNPEPEHDSDSDDGDY